MFFRRLIIAFVTVQLLLTASFAQDIRQFTVNYKQKEYGDSLNRQNWSVTQDKFGKIYFGNAYHVLTFDGINWSSIRTSVSGGYVLAMLNDSNRVYVGSSGNFGYIAADKYGFQKYISLSDSLDEKDQYFGDVWRIYKYRDAILFFSSETIFLYQDNKITTIYPKTSFHLVFVVNNNLYVRQDNIGLMKLVNGKFELLPNGEIFENYGVFGIFPVKDEKYYLIVTQELGLFKYYPDKADNAIKAIETSDYDILVKAQIIDGILLHDGNIALSTIRKGVIVINTAGEVVQLIDQNSGLQGNDVKCVFQDTKNNLWLAMNNGVSRVNYSSPISYYDQSSGIIGQINSISKISNRLIVGTSDGLFIQNKETTGKLYNYFIRVEGFNKNITALIGFDQSVVIGTNSGLYEYKFDLGIKRISDKYVSTLYYSEKQNLLYSVGNRIFCIYKKTPNWTLTKFDDKLQLTNVMQLTEKVGNNNQTELWLGSLNQGCVRIIVDKNLNINYQYLEGEKNGLENAWIKPFQYKNDVLFGTEKGLMQFIEDSDTASFQGYFKYSSLLNKDSVAISYISEAKQQAWICVDGMVNDFKNNKLDDYFYKSLPLSNINVLFYDKKNDLYVGADNGLAMIDLNKKENINYRIKPGIVLNRISCTNDSVLFYGGKQNVDIYPVIEYKNNDLVFRFASLNNENGQKAKYSYILEGYSKRWSKWTNETETIYENITKGKYIFKVKAKDIYGNESDIKSFSFEILAPWYRTWWMIIVYILFLGLIIRLIIKRSTIHLQKKNEELERIVQKRTVKIREQKERIEKIHKDITDSINYASHIQNAILPPVELFENNFSDYFILFKPRDVVSGDFYWARKISRFEGSDKDNCNDNIADNETDNELMIFVAADCTGHGVPGAFVSMLGISFFNEITQNDLLWNSDKKAALLLNMLRDKVKSVFQQKGSSSVRKDGMDLALCVIDIKTKVLQYAGANNPLCIVRNKSLPLIENSVAKTALKGDYIITQIKPDSMPIGNYNRENSFTNFEIQLESNDKLYMFSDGFPDQFGGKSNKKFKIKNFRNLLLDIHQKPMAEQKEILNETLINWMGTENEQIDDILVMGVEV